MLFYQGRYVYVNEEPHKPGRKTADYTVHTNDLHVEIARIGWYGSWRKFALYPHAHTVWESRCLTEMLEVIEKITVKHRLAHPRSQYAG